MEGWDDPLNQAIGSQEAVPGFLIKNHLGASDCVFHRLKKKCCRKFKKGRRCGKCPSR
jgi:hypothetical protein